MNKWWGLFALLGAGCLGSADSGDVGNNVDLDPPGNQTNVVCEAELSVTGTLGDVTATDDCVPNGTWNVTVSLVDEGDCTNVTFNQTYTYTVTGNNQDGFEYTYVEDPMEPNVNLKVTSGGGRCLGHFAHYSADGKTELLLKPVEENLALAGSGHFTVYTTSVLPDDDD